MRLWYFDMTPSLPDVSEYFVGEKCALLAYARTTDAVLWWVVVISCRHTTGRRGIHAS